jgi:DNA end-binding protein Ku
MRGKEHLVLLRPFEKGLMLHTLYYEDEVRPAEDVDQAGNEAAKEAELALAKRLIDELTEKKFEPSKYHDNYRERVLEVAQQKIAGQEITEPAAEPRRGQVIDLMAALKASLDKRGKAEESEGEKEERPATAHAKSEASRSRRASGERRRAGSKK